MASCLEPGDLAGFSALACRDRWLGLQRLREAAGAECLLLVLGPDANFGRGSEVAFNWLILGLSGRDLLAAPLDRKYEECVLCLTPTRSAVFCKHAAREEVVKRTAMWEACEVIVPTPQEESDVDAYDARKVGAFIHMVSTCSSIGVAVQGDGSSGSDLKMEIERWPLVQAYGYDEYGHGFLTLKKSVINLEPLLQRQAYPKWDLQSVAQAQGQVQKLQSAWQEALLVQDRNSPVGDRPAQATVTAPLVDYFEYGRLSLTDEDIYELRGESASQGAEQLLNPAPRVLVGAARTAQVLQGVTMEQLGSPPSPPEQDALHMVWEAIDPLVGISATRTYALSSTVCSAGPDGERLQALLRAYSAAVECCHHLLLADTLCASASSQNREAELRQAAVSFMHHQYPDVSGQPHVLCDLIDSMGLASDGTLQAGSTVLLFLRVAITDILCPVSQAVLGTVAYGDSIFCSLPPSAEMAATSCILTLALPRFAFWIAPNECERSAGIKAGTDSALGIGVPTVKYVALGHRPGFNVPLEPPKPPPDPLGLGSPIETSVRGGLAMDVAYAGPCQPLVGFARGTAWTFDSGKMVLFSLRTGYVIVQICRNDHGFPAVQAFDGLVWVPVQLLGPGLGGRLSAAVSPFTASQWRNLYLDTTEGSAPLPHVPDVDWVTNLPESTDVHETSATTEQDQDAAFVSTVALSAALGGRNLSATCGAAVKDAEAMRGDIQLRRCIWVAGLPGCGAYDVAAPLAKALNALLIDLGAVIDLDADPAADHMALVAASLASTIQASAHAFDTVVVCDVRCAPCEVLLGLSASRPLADICYVSHVIAILEPLVAYPWSSSRHPLALSLMHRRWVTLVVVQDYGLVEAGPAAREWHVFKDQLLLELRSCRGSGHILLKPPTSALVDCISQEPPPCAAQLALALPRLLAPPEGPGPRLRRVFAAAEAPLDLGALRERCGACLAEAARAAWPRAGEGAEVAWRGLFCIEVRVMGAVAGELWGREPEELWSACSSGACLSRYELVLAPHGDLRPPQNWTFPQDRALGVTWWWCLPAGEPPAKLQAAAAEALAQCRLRVPPARPLWSPADVPAEELARLEAEVQGAELPDGYFSTSTGYVDVDGKRRKDHPELEGRLRALLERHNAGVEAQNAALCRIAALPMFAGVPET